MDTLDPQASSAENAAAIREHLEKLDPELGAILAKYIEPEALAALDDAGRRRLRAQIAAEAKSYLDALMQEETE